MSSGGAAPSYVSSWNADLTFDAFDLSVKPRSIPPIAIGISTSTAPIPPLGILDPSRCDFVVGHDCLDEASGEECLEAALLPGRLAAGYPLFLPSLRRSLSDR